MTNEEYINQHPEQFKDDIDKWLFTEFGIIGGCCSAEKSHEYSVARMVAEKLTDAFVEKALKFLDGCIPDYMELKHANIDTFMDIDNERFIEDFKKYMKGE